MADDFQFIKETRKEKPINRKKFVRQMVKTIILAVVFGVVASLTFVVLMPRFEQYFTPEEPPQVSFEEPEPVEDVEEPPEEPEQTQDSEKPETVIIEKPTPLELSQYQMLQNKLYAVGREADKFIVSVTNVKNDTDIFNNPYEMEGQGSGIIIAENDTELLILTEKKVINGAKSLSATFIDESMCEVQIKKQDGNTGLAILSAQKANLTKATRDAIKIAPIGSSTRIKNGTMVIALGSPLGTNYSILTGNITSTENEITTEDHNYSLFTTDIIGSKDGSGILINVQGEVIGIVMQSYNTKSANNTLTAVAVSDLIPVIEMLCEGKAIPYLGLHVSTVTDKVAKAYDIPKGVYIREVTLDSPAMNTGLQSGDVIIQVNGEPVMTAGAYSAKLLACEPGQNVTLMVDRKGANGYSEITYTVEAGILK